MYANGRRDPYNICDRGHNERSSIILYVKPREERLIISGTPLAGEVIPANIITRSLAELASVLVLPATGDVLILVRESGLTPGVTASNHHKSQ